MYVVGATHPETFKQVRNIVPEHFLLVPGIGAQGGSLLDVVVQGINKDIGLLINSSRQIIYASGETDFDKAAGEEAEKLQQEMQHFF
jgi:orotidine-5'-phosphate decarboxylase